ncbi:unnamed protein product [Fusarium graminearum]|uniref:Chromosome 1, complete genome n=2 Tax=Gibberella zeae TaxID=5518 RepID=A0A098D0E5_GIBZE|nr:unnamed protein product [Fusarium graminearum]CAF3578029.1 unnamed protein product [Fusarium graminearum]CAG1986803.1 unnamed protein product [Fusarium graminearum]CAG2016137.1 unnamed protein product [Fusarium graminearum]CEF72378.1 unnamed protein product [Fusarium graminearum]
MKEERRVGGREEGKFGESSGVEEKKRQRKVGGKDAFWGNSEEKQQPERQEEGVSRQECVVCGAAEGS